MRVFVTPGTAPDFESVAATLRTAGHTVRSRARRVASSTHCPRTPAPCSSPTSWWPCPTGGLPESTTDVLTADGAGIPWGSVDEALATHRPPTRDRTALPSQQHPR